MQGRGSGLMRAPNLKNIRAEQGGFALVEVLVSAMLLIIVSAGFVLSFAATNRATAQERHRAKANSLAEQELERVRSLRIADLSTLNRASYVLDDGTTASTCPAPGS